MNQHQRIVTEVELEKALDFLRDNAKALGEAKARVVKAGHMLKHLEALEYKKSDSKTTEAKKADARTSEAFVAAIIEDAEAAGAYEMMKSLREAAALKIESWRSEQANYRAMRV
jgi:dsRNA-specific ribonuclease